MTNQVIPKEVHRLSGVSFAGKRRCTCGRRAEQDASGKWRHVDRTAK